MATRSRKTSSGEKKAPGGDAIPAVREPSDELTMPGQPGPLAGGSLPDATLNVPGEGLAERPQPAKRVVVIADSSKLGGHAFARICPISKVETLVTDSGAPEELLEGYRYANRRFYSAGSIWKRLSRSPAGLWWTLPLNLMYAYQWNKTA